MTNQPQHDDTPGPSTPARATAAPGTAEVRGMVCPECEEPVQQQPPTAIMPVSFGRPAWSHLDGEPLCPVMTSDGYAPAEPVAADQARLTGPADEVRAFRDAPSRDVRAELLDQSQDVHPDDPRRLGDIAFDQDDSAAAEQDDDAAEQDDDGADGLAW
jgi:hypothetical protein